MPTHTPQPVKHSDPLARAVARRDLAAPETGWSDEEFRAQRDRDLALSPMPVWPMVRATLLCLGLAALLTSGRIVEIAERQPLGERRDIAVDLAQGLDRVANALSLNRPADLIADLRNVDNAGETQDDLDELFDQVDGPAAGADGGGAGSASPTVPDPTGDPTTTADTGATVTSAPDGEDPSADTTVPPPTDTAPPADTVPPATVAVRTIAPIAPVRVYVAGDSQADPVASELDAAARDNGRPTAVHNGSRIATGLARPDYFNWPAELDAVATAEDPEVVVMVVGGNDGQDMQRDGQYFVVSTPEWAAEYEARVALVMDLLAADHRRIIWVNQPPLRDADDNRAADLINTAIANAAATRPWVLVVDAHAMFAAPDGSYTDTAISPDGETYTSRQDDGIHLTRRASRVLARVLDQAIAQWFPVAS